MNQASKSLHKASWLLSLALAIGASTVQAQAIRNLPPSTSPSGPSGQPPTRVDVNPPGQGPGPALSPPFSGPSQGPLPPSSRQQNRQQQPELVQPGRRVAEPGMTLENFVQIAMQSSPNLREAATQVEAARNRAYQASLYPNPTMGTASPQLAGSQTQYNAYMSQDLVTKGKLRLDSAAGERAAQQAELTLIRTRFELLTTIRQRFYAALAAQSRADVTTNLVVIARNSRDVGDRLLKGGEGSRTDAILLDIEYDRAIVAQQNAVILLEAAKRQLAAGTGVADLPVGRLSGALDAPLPDYNMIAVQQGVISRNAQAQIAQVEVARNQLLLQRAEVEPFPNFNFLGGYQYQLSGAHAPDSQAIYQVQAVVPLFNRNQGNIRAAQASVGTAMAQVGRVRNELANQTAAAIGRYTAAQQMASRYELQILPKARETQRLTQQLYAEGQTDFLRLLQAQRTLVEANLGYINAQEARWTAAAEVAGLLQSNSFP